MKKLVAFLLLTILSVQTFANPDEGMWLPMFIKRLNAEEIAKHGCRLTPEEIYSINTSSLKDAIVWLEFCTAEIVSDKGLILTNHHCAYGGIQSNSSVEHNYLDNGFWAANHSEELPVKGQKASVLVRMADLTEKVLSSIPANASNEERNQAVKKALKAAEAEASENGRYRAIAKDMFNGNEFYLFVYETFRDIRLVGVPPQNIGKFGGDTDNWMWPRHTGDFSFMRIYSGKDGKPADYSAENIPYTPRHVLPVSTAGYDEGDYAMIMGFPGRTNRYDVSASLRLIMEKNNPAQILLLGKKLETWKKFMDQDTKIRIQYSSKYASTSNGWKYRIGQNEGLKRLGILEQKGKEEAAFQAWVDGDAGRTQKYGNLMKDYKAAIAEYEPTATRRNYLSLAGRAPELLGIAGSLEGLVSTVEKQKDNTKAIDSAKTTTLAMLDEVFTDYHAATDHEVMKELYLLYISNVPEADLPPSIAEIRKQKGANDREKTNAFVDKLLAKSIFSSVENIKAFVQAPNAKKYRKDPVVLLLNNLNDYQKTKIAGPSDTYAAKTDILKRLYIEAMRTFRSDKKFYPDANSTLRMTYGNVASYEPKDAVHFSHFTTSDGVLDKYIPGDSEFDLPKKLIELLENRDFGPYAENGKLHVAFLTTNDITGGNSGSPVINETGELIGVAFDGNWEAMTGDLVFDPKLKRTICVDIRYVLFIVDKFAGAKNLLAELKMGSSPSSKSEAQAPDTPKVEPAIQSKKVKF